LGVINTAWQYDPRSGSVCPGFSGSLYGSSPILVIKFILRSHYCQAQRFQ